MKEVKKQRKKSTQALLGLQTFGKYGLKTEKGELVFLQCAAYEYIGAVRRKYKC